MILEHLAKRNDEWVKMARKFSEYPEDALQDAYLKIYERFKDKPEVFLEYEPQQQAMYMYLTLRSTSASNYKEGKKYADLPTFVEAEEEYDLSQDRQIERDLDLIYNEMNNWHWYDKKLALLHLEQGMSMREISRETGISLSSIFHTIKICKKRLRNKKK